MLNYLEIVALIETKHSEIKSVLREAVETFIPRSYHHCVVILNSNGTVEMLEYLEGYVPWNHNEDAVALFNLPTNAHDDSLETEIDNTVNWFLKAYED